MIKVFISVGMTGRSEQEVRDDISRAKSNIRKSILDSEVIDNYDCQKPDGESRLWYLGEAIKKLGNCDICYFVKGWEKYRGCRIEYEVCKLYGIKIKEEA